jgi:hypothetical protein
VWARVTAPFDDALEDLGRSESTEDLRLLTRDLLARTDQALRQLRARQGDYERRRKLIARQERRSVEVLLVDLKKDLGDVFHRRHNAMIRDYESLRGSWTSASDAARRSMIALKGVLGRRTAQDEHDALPLEERLRRIHFDEEFVKKEMTLVAEKAWATYVRGWEQCLADLSTGVPTRHGAGGIPPILGGLGLPADFNLSAEAPALFGAGLAGAGGLAGAVLAAGWHTIGWTLLHLTLPLGIAAGVVYALVASVREEEEKRKQVGHIQAKLDEARKQLDRAIEADVGVEWRKRTAELAERVRERVATTMLCGGTEQQFESLVEILEDAREALDTLRWSTAGGGVIEGIFQDATKRLEKGDVAGAALLASAAFESAMLSWAEVAVAPLGPRRDGLLYWTIEELHRANLCDQSVRARLHDLRAERNRFVHDLSFVVDPDGGRDRVALFINSAVSVLTSAGQFR